MVLGFGGGSSGGTLVRVREGLAPIAAQPAGLGVTMRHRLLRGQPFEAGDPAFDERAHVEGQPMVLQALLDHGTRLAIRNLLAGAVNDAASGRTFTARATLRGELTFVFAEKGPMFLRGTLPMALRAILDLARRLVPPDSVADRLAENAREDPVEGVRLRNLEMLRKEYGGQPVASQALRVACGDASDVVRLYAASALGPEGRDVVRRLARSSPDDSCAARAVAVLGAELESGDAVDILRDALARATARHGRGLHRDPGGEGRFAVRWPTLCDALAVDAPAVAEAAARALQHHPAPESQEALIGHGLGHQNARRAHRRRGGARPDRHGGRGAAPHGDERARTGRRAPGRSRRRSPPSSRASRARRPGQLSMSAAEGGAVTLTPQGGEVSLPDSDGPPAGRS